MRQRDIDVGRQSGKPLPGAKLVVGIEEGKEIGDGNGAKPALLDPGNRVVDRGEIERLDFAPLPIDASGNAEAKIGSDERAWTIPLPPEQVLAPEPPRFQDVGEAFRSEKGHRLDRVLHQSVGRDGGSEHERFDAACVDSAPPDGFDHAAHGVGRRVGLFGQDAAVSCIDREEIGEGSSDIDTNVHAHAFSFSPFAHAPVSPVTMTGPPALTATVTLSPVSKRRNPSSIEAMRVPARSIV